jgi:hypothetical protein
MAEEKLVKSDEDYRCPVAFFERDDRRAREAREEPFFVGGTNMLANDDAARTPKP